MERARESRLESENGCKYFVIPNCKVKQKLIWTSNPSLQPNLEKRQPSPK